MNSAQCDLQSSLLPDNAETWSCDKPVNDKTVLRSTKCSLVCLEGHDLVKGKQRLHFPPYISNIDPRQKTRFS